MISRQETPAGWTESTFGDVVESISINGKKVPKANYLAEGRYPVVDQGRAPIAGYSNDATKLVSSGLPVLVFGDHTRHFKYRDQPFVPGADGVKVLRPVGVNPKWLFHIAHALEFPDKGYARHYQHLKLARLPVPPPLEQERIVAEIEKQFTRLDASVAALKRVQANLKRYRRAILGAASEGRIRPESSTNPGAMSTETAAELLDRMLTFRARHALKAPERPNRIAGRPLPKGWKVVSLDELLLNITDGDHQPPPQTDEGIPFVMIGNVRSGKLDLSDTRFVSPEYASQVGKFRKPQRGDILFTLVGSFGHAVLVDTDEEFCIQRHIAILRPHALSPTEFIVHVLNSPGLFSQASAAATGTAQKTVPLAALRRFAIPLPPLAEQHVIVEEVERRLSGVDDLERTVEANLQRAKTLRQSILHRAFSGQL